jgi:DNA repair/transcription protein MET18/MMS19
MPLLLRGLDLPDFAMRASVLDTLYASAAGAPDEGKPAEQASVAEHAPSLVAAMLQNSAHASMPSAVRPPRTCPS